MSSAFILLKSLANTNFDFLARPLLDGDIGGSAFLEGLSAVDLVAPLLPLLRLPDVGREVLSWTGVSVESRSSVLRAAAVPSMEPH